MFRLLPLGLYLVASIAAAPGTPAHAGESARYVGGGAAVARTAGNPTLDEGSVVCDNGEGEGVGGFCVPFGGGDAVRVVDDAAGEDVAFQVCVDNDGDGRCTSPPKSSTCPDEIAFSHDDKGNFFNPVGPLPTGFLPGCTGGPWHGYVVFLCQGTHVAGYDAGHAHPATSGTGTVTSGGEGGGNFCGGTPVQPSSKRYFLGGARYASGGAAVVREGGQPAADEGSVVCDAGDGVGAGGFCVPFGAGDAVAVTDEANGERVAFQACVDNNGDGRCTSPDFDPVCPDQIAFSHDDDGSFANPLGPLPTGFLPGCPGGPWPGYVVFLCEGAHVANDPGHVHPATTGEGKVTTGGEGNGGNFCGGTPVRQSSKPYSVGVGGDAKEGLCGFAGIGDRSREGGDIVTGQVTGGPVAAARFGDKAAEVTLECTIQVGSGNSTANGSEAAVVVAAGKGVAVVPPTLVSFVAPAGEPVYVCTAVTVAGTTYRYDFASGDFTTDPGAECVPVPVPVPDPDPDAGPQPGPLGDLLALLDRFGRDVLSPVLCPLLAQLAPGIPGVVDITPEGDVLLFGEFVLDCPPFGSL